MSDLQTQFDHLISEHQRIRAEFQKSAQTLFKNITKEFFATNSGIKAVKWSQATPYFNDGDACIFRVNDAYFTNATGEELDSVNHWGEYCGDDESILVFGSWELKSKAIEGVDAAQVKLFETMISTNAMEEVLQEMFGDHVIITATAEGFDVAEYEHD